MKSKEVTRILMAFKKEDLSKKDTVSKLQNAEALDLYMAELNLMDEGFQPKDLADISDIYIQLIYDNSTEIIKSLEKDHPVRNLILEHKRLNSFLLVLEGLINDDRLEREDLKDIIKNLEKMKTHMEMEEEIIFPRVNEEGGRTLLFKQEHNDFLDKLRKLKGFVDSWDENKEKIKELIRGIIYDLRKHTFVENDLFYPVILDILDDWDRIKEELGKIGHSEFSLLKI